MAVGVTVFVVALVVSIMLHEAGHFLCAKRFGMKATQFFFGFGPTLWSFRRGETEYGVKAIPAGGFVKIVGMTQLEEVAPGDEDRAFYRQPAGRRAIVLSAGSAMHFLLALLVIYLVFAAVGQSQPVPTVAAVSPCVPAALTASCHHGQPESPAARAGLRPGDRIVAVDGVAIHGWDQLKSAIADRPDRAVTLTLQRARRTLTLRVTVARTAADTSGAGAHQLVGFLGVQPATEVVRESVLGAAGTAFARFGGGVVDSLKALGEIPASLPRLFSAATSQAPRNPNGVTSLVGVARVSGQAFAQHAPLADRLSELLYIVFAINVFVGVFNLLPLLPLDGGHLAVLGFERARSVVYRLVGRPDPGRVDLARLLPAAYLVVALFVGLALLLVYADIVNPIRNPFTG